MISAGDALAMLALASRVYERSHAGWAVASVFLAFSVPVALLAPLSGILLDRLRPKPVLTAAAAAAAVVALALIEVTGVPGTLGLASGFGLCAALLQPGLGVIGPRLISDQTVITRANSCLQAATWGGMTAGPLLAGLLTATGGAGLALGGDAVLYALGAAGLVLLRLAPPSAAVPAQPGGLAGLEAAGRDLLKGTAGAPELDLQTRPPGREPMSVQLRAGMTWLRSDRTAMLLVVMVAIMVAFGYLAVVAEVVLAQGVLRAGPGGYAILVAYWTAGMVAGSLSAGRLPARWLVAAAIAGTIITGIGIALAGLAAHLWQAAAAYGAGGAADGVDVLATRSYLNSRAPAAVAGRVFALYSGLQLGAASVGMAAASGLLAPLGARLLLVIAGCGGIVAGMAGWVSYARRARYGGRCARVTVRGRPG